MKKKTTEVSKKEIATRKPATPCVLVIFGIAGDLTKRLLYPALCNLGSKGLLAENFCIVGVAIEKFSTKSFQAQLTKDIKEFISDPAAKKYGLSLKNRVHYISGEFDAHKTYVELKRKLTRLSADNASSNYLFYFASPPEFIGVIAT